DRTFRIRPGDLAGRETRVVEPERNDVAAPCAFDNPSIFVADPDGGYLIQCNVPPAWYDQDGDLVLNASVGLCKLGYGNVGLACLETVTTSLQLVDMTTGEM